MTPYERLLDAVAAAGGRPGGRPPALFRHIGDGVPAVRPRPAVE